MIHDPCGTEQNPITLLRMAHNLKLISSTLGHYIEYRQTMVDREN